uniref:Uncharacterized protein n=1 Tax=Anopheles farauti TaxID=69004 RepID=A0A182Q968_9DIPT
MRNSTPTDFSPGVPPSSVSMLIVCMGLLKLAVLDIAATWPGLPLSPISIALPSDSALDSSDEARIFRRSFFRLSSRRLGLEGGHRLVELNVPLVDVLMLVVVVDAGQITYRDRSRYDRIRARIDGRQRMEASLRYRRQWSGRKLGELRQRTTSAGARVAAVCGRLGGRNHIGGTVRGTVRTLRTLLLLLLLLLLVSHEGSSSAENDVNDGRLCWVVSSAVLALIIEVMLRVACRCCRAASSHFRPLEHSFITFPNPAVTAFNSLRKITKLQSVSASVGTYAPTEYVRRSKMPPKGITRRGHPSASSQQEAEVPKEKN